MVMGLVVGCAVGRLNLGRLVFALRERSLLAGLTRSHPKYPFGILYALRAVVVYTRAYGPSLADSWTESPDGRL